MACVASPILVALPALRAKRVWTDVPYSGVKEALLLSRFEQGRSQFWAHGRTWKGRPGSVICFRPGDVHRDIEREGSISYQFVFLPTPELDLSDVLGCFSAEDPRGAPARRLHDAVAAHADAFTLDCLVSEVLGGLARLAEARPRLSRPVRRALGLIRERMTEALSLDELAEYAALDKFHLCRAFRAQVGMPPHTYLTQLRVLRAKELLSSGTRPSEVAAQVGLYDQSQLNRHFKRIVGTTPGQFFAKNQQSAAPAE